MRQKGSHLTILLTLVAILPSLGCASWQPHQKAAEACVLADAVTTAYGLSDGRQESNPAGLEAGAALGGVSFALAFNFDRNGQRENVWRVAAGVRCAAAAWNLAGGI